MSYRGKLTAVSYPAGRSARRRRTGSHAAGRPGRPPRRRRSRVCSSGFRLKERYLGFPCREARAGRRDRQKGPGRADGGGCRPARAARTTSAGSRAWSSQTATARVRHRAPLPLNPLPWPGREPRAVSGIPKVENSSRWRGHSSGARCGSGECRFIYGKPAPHIGGIVMARRPAPAAIPGGTHRAMPGLADGIG